MPPATQVRNEGGKGAQFPCRRITMGVPQSPNNVRNTFFNTVHLLPKDLRFEHRGAKAASCPGGHLTSFHPCCYGSSRTNSASLAQQCLFFVHASFYTAQYKTTKLTTISSHCLAAFSARCLRSTVTCGKTPTTVTEPLKICCHVIVTQ